RSGAGIKDVGWRGRRNNVGAYRYGQLAVALVDRQQGEVVAAEVGNVSEVAGGTKRYRAGIRTYGGVAWVQRGKAAVRVKPQLKDLIGARADHVRELLATGNTARDPAHHQQQWQ